MLSTHLEETLPTLDEHEDSEHADADADADAAAAACDECQDLEAELLAHYPGIRDRPPRWCAHCAGPELAALVAAGLVVTVTSTDLRMIDDPRPAAVRHEAGNAMPAGLTDHEPGVLDLKWTVELAVKVVRSALPPGRVFLRALVDEGGTATAERLKELTGARKLNGMTLTVNAAVRTATTGRRLRHRDRHLAKPLRDPDNPRRSAVVGYELPAALVPILDQALTQASYPPGASRLESA